MAQEHALIRPRGLRSLVLADTAASFPDFVAAANRLSADLPLEVEATLRRHEGAGTTDDPEYAEACHVFYARHVCRLESWPPEVMEAFAWIERDPTMYHTMNGPSEFHVVGSIKDWQSKDRLASIEAPTLLVSGRYDEATPALQETLHSGFRVASGCCWRTRNTCRISKSKSATCRSSATGSPGTTNPAPSDRRCRCLLGPPVLRRSKTLTPSRSARGQRRPEESSRDNASPGGSVCCPGSPCCLRVRLQNMPIHRYF